MERVDERRCTVVRLLWRQAESAQGDPGSLVNLLIGAGKQRRLLGLRLSRLLPRVGVAGNLLLQVLCM